MKSNDTGKKSSIIIAKKPIVGRLYIIACFLLFIIYFLFPSPCTSAESIINITADNIEYSGETNVYNASGSVRIIYEDATLQADRVRFNNITADVVADENVIYEDPSVIIKADKIELNSETRLGTIYNSNIFYKNQNLHMQGGNLQRLGKTTYFIDSARATTCDAPRPEWHVKGKDIRVNLNENIKARNTTFYIKDIPVLYSPYFWAPLLRERQSGLLIPVFGYSSTKGYTFKEGFFWAIKDNMDATLYADFFNRKGVGKGIDYRYMLTPETSGELWMYHLRDNDLLKDFFELKSYHNQELPYDMSGYLKMHIVNTFDYYTKLKSTSYDRIGMSSMGINPFGFTTEERLQKYLESDLQISKPFTGGRVYLLGQYRQSLEESSGTIPQTLPELAFIINTRDLGPASFNLSATGTNFRRDNGQDGQRLDVYPNFYLSAGRTVNFTQKIGVRETLYFLKNPSQNSNREIFDLNSIISTRLLKRYPSFIHIIEPSVEYAYIPAVDQSDIPAFESIDFIQRKSAVTYSFTNRLAGDALGGLEARLRLSNSYSLLDAEKPFSPVIIESNITSKNLSLNANAFYDVYDKKISETITSLDVRGKKWFAGVGKNFRLSTNVDQYSFKAGLYAPIDVFGKSIPLSFSSKLLYDLKGGGFQELNFQSKYTKQCWGIGVSITRRPFEYQVLFAIEFRGIGEIKMGKIEDIT